MASKIIKKTLEEAAGVQNAELDFSDKALISLEPQQDHRVAASDCKPGEHGDSESF